MTLTKAQQAFLDYCKELEWGTFYVIVKNGEPVMITQPKKDIKLT